MGLGRVLAIPVIMALILVDGEGSWMIAGVLFAAAALTDILDGHLARRWGITTVLGGFLDSTADKLLVSGSLLALLVVGRVSVWVVFIIIAREIVITAIRGIVALRGVVVPPSVWGKAKTAVQFVAVLLAILRAAEPLGPYYLDEYFMWAAAAATIASGYQYAKSFWAVMRSVDSKPA